MILTQVGSTGLSMIYEIVTQLRGETDALQVTDCRYGLTEKGGEAIASEEYACCVNILEKV